MPYRLKLELKTYSKILIKGEGFNLYTQKCASCHGKYRNGTFDFNSTYFNDVEKDFNQKYIPSLVGHTIYNLDYKKYFNVNYINTLHEKEIINQKEEVILNHLFAEWDQKINKEANFFYEYNWTRFVNPYEIPATNPPWGEIVAIDIKDGKKIWKKPIGKIGDKLIGTPIFGGIALNNGGILVATGTNDNLVYFINQNNGDILKTFKMLNSRSSPPIIYKDDEGEKISITSGVMNYPGFNKVSEIEIYTFSLN